jgi:hypothetical protein
MRTHDHDTTDLLEAYRSSGDELGPQVLTGQRPGLIQFRTSESSVSALPYGLLMSAEIEDKPRDNERVSGKQLIKLTFRESNVLIAGDRLDLVYAAIVEQRVTLISKTAPAAAAPGNAHAVIRDLIVSWRAQ